MEAPIQHNWSGLETRSGAQTIDTLLMNKRSLFSQGSSLDCSYPNQKRRNFCFPIKFCLVIVALTTMHSKDKFRLVRKWRGITFQLEKRHGHVFVLICYLLFKISHLIIVPFELFLIKWSSSMIFEIIWYGVEKNLVRTYVNLNGSCERLRLFQFIQLMEHLRSPTILRQMFLNVYDIYTCINMIQTRGCKCEVQPMK